MVTTHSTHGNTASTMNHTTENYSKEMCNNKEETCAQHIKILKGEKTVTYLEQMLVEKPISGFKYAHCCKSFTPALDHTITTDGALMHLSIHTTLWFLEIEKPSSISVIFLYVI